MTCLTHYNYISLGIFLMRNMHAYQNFCQMYHTLLKLTMRKIYTATYRKCNIMKHTFSHNFCSGNGTTFLWPESHTAIPPVSFHTKIRLFLTH